MQSVIQFGIAAKNGEIAAQALKILRGLAPLAARAAAKQMKQNNLACEEVSEAEMEETEKADWSDVSSIMYLAEVKGVEEAEKMLEKYGECYAALKRLGASGELLQKFTAKAKEFYLYFDEYVNCMHLWSVCFRTNLCVLVFSNSFF